LTLETLAFATLASILISIILLPNYITSLFLLFSLVSASHVGQAIKLAGEL